MIERLAYWLDRLLCRLERTDDHGMVAVRAVARIRDTMPPGTLFSVIIHGTGKDSRQCFYGGNMTADQVRDALDEIGEDTQPAGDEP